MQLLLCRLLQHSVIVTDFNALRVISTGCRDILLEDASIRAHQSFQQGCTQNAWLPPGGQSPACAQHASGESCEGMALQLVLKGSGQPKELRQHLSEVHTGSHSACLAAEVLLSMDR